MTVKQFAKISGAVAAFVAIMLAGMLVAPRVRAQHEKDDDRGRAQQGNNNNNNDDDNNDIETKVRIGFQIAPVKLNLAGKVRELVGLGSYIVNAQADCNGCHNPDPATEFTPSGNPYLLPPVFNGKKQFNPATYLSGGMDFGPLIPGSAHIISRNLTPSKTGLPEGDLTFQDFRQIMRTGVDFDHLHPTCTGAPNANCIPFPFNGALLQIMPWPIYQSMTDHDLRAIYEYLSAIPCIAGPPAPNPLHHDCH